MIHTVHPYAPDSQKPCCQGFPLPLPKPFTQVDQLQLSVWSIHRELSHTGGHLRMPRGPQASHASLSAAPRASLPTRDPQVSQCSWSSSLMTSLSEELGPQGHASCAPVHADAAPMSLCNSCSCAASQRAPCTPTFRAVGKIHLRLPAREFTLGRLMRSPRGKPL